MNKKLIDIVSTALEISNDHIDPEKKFDEYQNWDSMKQIMILGMLEDEFNITLDDDEILQMINCSTANQIIESKSNAK